MPMFYFADLQTDKYVCTLSVINVNPTMTTEKNLQKEKKLKIDIGFELNFTLLV